MTALFAGLGLGLSLVIAIGAQSVFVLRQGIRREHVLAVVVVCETVRWAGAVFLVGYGLLTALGLSLVLVR